ncbi:hypothetical protein YK23_002020 [Salmonella enterica subsp. enterica]|nr:hypothetical protein [Salmonella enterica subsp. enterica serovar Ealing]
MRRYHRKEQSLANRCKALCVPFLSRASILLTIIPGIVKKLRYSIF